MYPSERKNDSVFGERVIVSFALVEESVWGVFVKV